MAPALTGRYLSTRLRYVVGVAVLAASYVLAGRLGFTVAPFHPVVSLEWPPFGVALAALLLLGRRFWPGITLGAFAATLMGGVGPLAAASIAVGNTFEALLGVWLLTGLAGFRVSLERLRDVLALVALGALASAPVSATIGATALTVSGATEGIPYSTIWLAWCSGDVIGVLVVTPLLLTWGAGFPPRPAARAAVEASVLSAVLVASTVALFQVSGSYVYAIFPVALWAAVRFGPRGAATGSFVVAVLAVWYTVRGVGPFATSTTMNNLFQLQTFMGLLGPTALILAAAISERRAAEVALQWSQQQYRDIVHHTSAGVYQTDSDGQILLANPALARILGYERPEELVGRNLADDVSWDRGQRAALIAQYEPVDERHGLEVRWKRKDGSLIWVDVHAHVVKDGAGRTVYREGVVYDITKRRKVEAKFRGLLESAPDAVILADRDGRITLANKQTENLFGYPVADLLGQRVEILIPERFRARHGGHRAGYFGHPTVRAMGSSIELYALRRDGTEFPVEIRLGPLETEEGTVVTAAIRDVTGRKDLEAQLRQGQKIEAIGRLAGGVAHDFNNLLTAILGFSDLLREECPEGDPRRADLTEISNAALRGGALTQQLLAFSRKQVLTPRVFSLNDLVRNTEKMLHRLISEDINLVTVPAPDLGYVKADSGQVEQVLMNLVVNARDAMPTGGRLTIETANVELDEEYAHRNVGATAGPHVMLAVSDTGVGMDEATKARLFEPFFTTKGEGKGSGLGLATVYGIVKQSGGSVWVYSESDQGATFKVYLPRVPAENAEELAQPAPRARPTGTETVLVAEDAEMVRALARRSLEAYGYTVLQASHPDEAIALSKRQSVRIDLLLTDVIMPGMSGPELAERVRVLRPGIKVLYMSGYSHGAMAQHEVLATGAAYLQKPFTPANLAQRVRDVLDAAERV